MTGDAVAPARATGGAAFQQLYYTSCEHGLSGFSGFQFNAVSAGVSAETMHAVEAMAGYDPPRSMVESDTPDQLTRCPVNLSYVPDGHGAIALCAQYVGRDSARRFGNYFAHALHSGDFAAASGGMLGIELWGSPVWTAAVAPGTEIPALAAPPPRGPLTPRAVRAFLRGHPHADRLPSLLAAAFGALGDGGSVVVIDSSTERIAHWFAAVSYLLPPVLARQLSFATYRFRPTRSRLHLIGTVPQAHPVFGPDDEESYTVFDFCAGRFPDVVLTHHLVGLLTRIGVGSIRSVWSWTAEYAHGGERDPGDWHAPVAAAAAAGGIALTGPDVAAVIDWLAGADHLQQRRATVAADLHREHRDLDDGQLTALSAAALAGGDTALHQEIEGKLHESRMRAFMAAADGSVEPVPIADPTERGRATALWQGLIGKARTTRERVRLLLWARSAGLTPPGELIGRETLSLARTLVGSPSTGPALRREVERLADELPEFRRGLVTSLQEALTLRTGQEQLFAQFPALLLDERDLAGRPALLEHYWFAQAEREPARTVELMFQILAERGATSPDSDLLHALWRQPSRTWTHQEAALIARRLPAGQAVHDAVGEWFDRAVKQDVRDEDDLMACLRLCELLSSPARYPWLRVVTQECVATTIHLDTALRDSREATALAHEFTVPATEMWAPPRALKRYRLVAAMLRTRADPRRLRTGIEEFGFATADSYLRAVRGAAVRGEHVDDVLLSHVAGVVLVSERARLPQTHQDLITAIRSHVAHHWRPADTARLAHAVRPCAPALADLYADCAEQRLSRSQKWVRKITRRRPPDEAPGAAPDSPPKGKG